MIKHSLYGVNQCILVTPSMNTHIKWYSQWSVRYVTRLAYVEPLSLLVYFKPIYINHNCFCIDTSTVLLQCFFNNMMSSIFSN